MGPPKPPAPGLRPAHSFESEAQEWHEELTPALTEQLCAAARVGGFKAQTALACGVRPELLEWWLDEGLRPDAPEPMRRLSVRFQSITQGASLSLVNVVRNAAEAGDWQAAFTLLKHRETAWRGSDRFVERLNAPPESSLADRKARFIALLRSPTPEMAEAMKEAGITPPAPKLPEG